MTPQKRGRRADGEATRERILGAALKLFRKRGFERTTMRDIAAEASVSLGAAYHYFASKDAIVFDYYVLRERDLTAQIEAPLAASKDLRERLGIIVHGKLEQCRGERRLLGGLFRAATDPESPVSVFAAETSSIRLSSVGRFAEALRDEPLPVELRFVAAEGLWIVHLGILLFFLHDRSAGRAAPALSPITPSISPWISSDSWESPTPRPSADASSASCSR